MPVLKTPPEQTRDPVLEVTGYERVSSFLMAIVVGLCLSVFSAVAVYVASQPDRSNEALPIELVELSGGDEDGSIDETLKLDSPDPETQDPSLAEEEAEENEIEELLDNVLELSDEAAEQSNRQYELDARNAGQPGSAAGTGRRALGFGTGQAGIPRDQRWFIRYSSRQTVDVYARQLDFFGIELGAIIGEKILYLSKLDTDRPTVKAVSGGGGEKRLYMTWQGGNRRAADLKLFERAGIDAAQRLILQFIPPDSENTLATLERDHRNRPVEQIRRTYFGVRRAGQGYEFFVSRQIYFQ